MTTELTHQRRWWHWIIDHNPFYLLSAVFMLFGCLLLFNSLSWSPMPMQRVLVLIFTLQFYEILLLCCVAILVWKQLFRDAAWLVVMEAFFIVDISFLNAEIFSIDFSVGMWTNLIVWLLTMAKVYAFFRILKLPLNTGFFAFVLAQLTLLICIPGYLEYMQNKGGGKLSAGALYAAWWIGALVPALHAMLVRSPKPGSMPMRLSRVLFWLMTFLPLASIVAHLATGTWIYDQSFYPPHLSPMLLAIAAMVGHLRWAIPGRGYPMRLHFVLPFVAMSFAAIMRTHWPLHFAGPFGIQITPLRLAMVVAVPVYLDGWLFHRKLRFLLAACVCGGLTLLGATILAIFGSLGNAVRFMIDTLKRLIPTTMSEWGAVSVAASFVTLGIGLLVSLTRRVIPIAVVSPAATHYDEHQPSD